MFRTVKILFNLEHGWSVEHKSCNEMMLKLINRCDRKEICLLDHFCQFECTCNCQFPDRQTLSPFFFSGGTEHQNYSMEQDSMMKELIFGKKEKKIVYTVLLCFSQTCSHGLSSSCSQAVF